MINIKNICVFASSSNSLDNIYYEAASELGELIAQEGFKLIYGGSRRGSMWICAEAAKNNNGKVVGIMPERIAHTFKCNNHEDCDEFYLTAGMRERKALLVEKSDAVIAIAGGFGTLEEVSEMIVQKQLGYNNKPIVFLNTNGFYNNLFKFFEDTFEQHFANQEARNLYFVASTPKEAIEYIKNYVPLEITEKYVYK